MANKQTVLIVEDESNIASFITTILTANGYAVLTAQTGSTAMMLINSHSPDIIILDLGLPDMDGQNIIKSVRSWSQVPIIVLSARTQEREKVNVLDMGADDYITSHLAQASCSHESAPLCVTPAVWEQTRDSDNAANSSPAI